jgi:hypothetical protein
VQGINNLRIGLAEVDQELISCPVVCYGEKTFIARPHCTKVLDVRRLEPSDVAFVGWLKWIRYSNQ